MTINEGKRKNRVAGYRGHSEGMRRGASTKDSGAVGLWQYEIILYKGAYREIGIERKPNTAHTRYSKL